MPCASKSSCIRLILPLPPLLASLYAAPGQPGITLTGEYHSLIRIIPPPTSHFLASSGASFSSWFGTAIFAFLSSLLDRSPPGGLVFGLQFSHFWTLSWTDLHQVALFLDSNFRIFGPFLGQISVRLPDFGLHFLHFWAPPWTDFCQVALPF
ncbi:hypothetical protein EDD16DRAFT_1529170 [Pisolithus croceorrhizus]|nr:hypothetical protein EDD16DRAFT_1529170 [Pisolithus croceorrhizus]